MLETVSLHNKTGHLFVVYTEFNEARADAKNFMCKELYTPIFQKDKVLDPNKRHQTLRKGTKSQILL